GEDRRFFSQPEARILSQEETFSPSSPKKSGTSCRTPNGLSVSSFLQEFFPGLLRELVAQSCFDQPGQLDVRLVPFSDLLQGQGQQPARLALEIGADAHPHGAFQVALRLARLAAKQEDLAAPEEGLAVELVGGEQVVPLIDQIQRRPVVARRHIL